MRLITTEEHFQIAPIRELAQKTVGPQATYMSRVFGHGLEDLGAGRLEAMDAAGIDMQVMSHTYPGVEVLDAADAVPLAREANDVLADAIARYPDRFGGFAMLPVQRPTMAADELERAVTRLGLKGAAINGRVEGRFLDDPAFAPIFERAEALDVPIYLHPGGPTAGARDEFYGGLPDGIGQQLSFAAWGWHIETGLHVLRLIATGLFDRVPRLQLIVGHMGEVVPFMLDRANSLLTRELTGLQRPLKEYFLQNVHVTPSGMFVQALLTCVVELIGADRIIFSVDYPYVSNAGAREFLGAARISSEDKEKIAHINAERLLRL